ncbi:MAG: ABC-F family ATP-binding cassette domain-containing protein [Chloroflexi bacterium]|nr:ABC-F family ATP-binding cassette domain-containing protein [Chloroflexota bacterium]
MAILTAHHIGQSFGSLDLFSGVTASIPNDGKVGLVGPNGVGKTTLLLILAGISKSAAGSVHVAKGTRLGYLPQEASQAFAGQEHTVYDELLTVFASLREDERWLRQMEQEMAAGQMSDGLLEEYSKLQTRFETAGGYDYEVRIKQVLTGLGFDEPDWRLPLPHLSGGQKTRLLLARLLLEQPDLLILDEPTNHLDVTAVQWLEGALKIWPGAILVVSHDRYFLDNVVNNIWEMSHMGVQTYHGNYSAYVQQRQHRWEKQLQAYADFWAHIEKQMDYIRRHIAGQRTQMAQGKLSRLSREVAAYRAGGLDALMMIKSKGWLQVTNTLNLGRIATTVGELQQQISEIRSPQRPSHMHITLNASHRSGELVLRTKKLEIGYPGTPLFQADDIELRRTECAAFIGPNGSGKSTFLKTVLAQIEPLQGEFILGASLELAYFAQAHEQLNIENTVLDELLDHKNMLISEARNYLAQFLFRGDNVYKRISMLSGGERGRLSLAILALAKANFLLLDEPTNHLDIPAQETLQEALEQYGGTLLMVSHDRYLVDRLATQIWELRHGRLHIYNCRYQEYLTIRQGEMEAAKKAAQTRRQTAKETDEAMPDGRQLSKNEQRRRQQALAQIEDKIEAAEQNLQQVTVDLQKATEAQSFDKIQSLSQAYALAETELAQLMEQWENFHE